MAMTAEGEKRDLLFLTPVAPQVSGTGTGMRAAAHIEALAKDFRITLCLLTPFEHDAEKSISREMVGLCHDIFTVSTPPSPLMHMFLRRKPIHFASELAQLFYPRPIVSAHYLPSTKAAANLFKQRAFDTVFCFRLHASHFAKYMRRNHITSRRLFLDLDDYESQTQFRSSWVLRNIHGRVNTFIGLLDGLKLRNLEREMVSRFDLISVCSEIDRLSLARRFGCNKFLVIPNIVRTPTRVESRHGEAFTLLFLGNMNYRPNADAAEYLCREVIPRLRQGARRFRVLIAGRGSLPSLAHLASIPEVELMGEVADVGECYARADVAVVPLRTGGGTRIKIIEAFSHRVPVVSTPVGAEGLDVVDREHLLLAEGADALAARCQELMGNASLGEQLANDGYRLWEARYTIEAMQRQLGRFLETN